MWKWIEDAMRKFVVLCALAVTTTVPAFAEQRTHITIANSVGQPVYDALGFKVGVIEGETRETGSLTAIVYRTNIGGDGNHRVLLHEALMQPRSGGGWLAGLTPYSINQFFPYVPGKMRHD
jgi:hypothetical protein